MKVGGDAAPCRGSGSIRDIEAARSSTPSHQAARDDPRPAPARTPLARPPAAPDRTLSPTTSSSTSIVEDGEDTSSLRAGWPMRPGDDAGVSLVGELRFIPGPARRIAARSVRSPAAPAALGPAGPPISVGRDTSTWCGKVTLVDHRTMARRYEDVPLSSTPSSAVLHPYDSDFRAMGGARQRPTFRRSRAGSPRRARRASAIWRLTRR